MTAIMDEKLVASTTERKKPEKWKAIESMKQSKYEKKLQENDTGRTRYEQRERQWKYFFKR